METASEGPVIFTCSACSARYPLNWMLAGKTIHCKACGQIVTAAPELLTIPAHAPIEAVRQLGDALTEAAGMTAAAYELLLQYNRKQTEQETVKQTEWQALTTTKTEEIATLSGQVRDLTALLQESRKKSEADIADLQGRLHIQETKAYELALELKTREEKLQTISQKENLLKTLCDSIESSLKKDIDAHQNLLATLRQQLKFG